MGIVLPHGLIRYRIVMDQCVFFGGGVDLYGIIGPRCENTGLRGFRPGPTQTGLYSHRSWQEA